VSPKKKVGEIVIEMSNVKDWPLFLEKRGFLIILSNIINRVNNAKKRVEYYGVIRYKKLKK